MTEQYATVSEETKALITKFNNDGRIDLLCQLQTVTSFADLDQFVLEMTKAGIRLPIRFSCSVFVSLVN